MVLMFGGRIERWLHRALGGKETSAGYAKIRVLPRRGYAAELSWQPQDTIGVDDLRLVPDGR